MDQWFVRENLFERAGERVGWWAGQEVASFRAWHSAAYGAVGVHCQQVVVALA